MLSRRSFTRFYLGSVVSCLAICIGIKLKYNFDLELVNNNSLLLILQQIKPDSTVLEFGPANGRLTKYLNKELNCDVYLAELDEAAGKEALEYGKELVVGDIENYEWYDVFRKIKFDYILFADVLEHLRDPKSVLAKSKLLLKQEGSFLLSVPNMAHNSVLIDLMRNELCYTNVGLLDNTHIHFFTYNSLERMLKECDLYPCRRMGTYCEVGKTEITNSVYDIAGISPEYWNTRQYGEVYQFVYEVKKGREYITEELNLLNPYYNHYWLQTFVDSGAGIHEEFSSKYYLDMNVKNHKYEFDIQKEWNIFRIDPINTSCLIKITEFKIISEGREENIVIDYINAENVWDNLYCFQTSDPSILVNLDHYKEWKNPKIIFEYEIITYDSICIRNMSNLFEHYKDIFDEKQKQIEVLKQENERIRDELQKIREEYEELEKNKKNRFSINKK